MSSGIIINKALTGIGLSQHFGKTCEPQYKNVSMDRDTFSVNYWFARRGISLLNTEGLLPAEKALNIQVNKNPLVLLCCFGSMYARYMSFKRALPGTNFMPSNSGELKRRKFLYFQGKRKRRTGSTPIDNNTENEKIGPF